MSIKVQVRRDIANNWSNSNPTLASGELGFETNTNKLKIGNGSNTWNTLSYIAGGNSFIGTEVIFNSNVSNSAAISATKLSFTQNGSNAIVRTIDSRLKDWVSVKDFGAKGDGVTDDRQAIVDAVTYSKTNGKSVFFPAGQYFINPANGTITLEEVTLIGTGAQDGLNQSADSTLEIGSVFRIPSTGNTTSAFTIRRGVTLDGLAWYYNDQQANTAPIEYAPTLKFENLNVAGSIQFVYIRNCVAYNSYRWLNMGGDDGSIYDGAIGHIFIENNTICGIHRSMEIGWNLEVIKIRGNSFTYGHWRAAERAIQDGAANSAPKYMRDNSAVLEYKRGDGIFFTDNMLYGQYIGIFMQTPEKIALCRISNNTFDKCRFGIARTASGANAEFSKSQIIGNDFASGSPPWAGGGADLPRASGILISSSDCPATEHLVIAGNSFGASSNDSIFIAGNNRRRITINGNSFAGIGEFRTSGNYYALLVDGSNTDILFSGNEIGQDSQYAGGVRVASGRNINLIGNDFQLCNSSILVTQAQNLLSVGNRSTNSTSTLADSISGVTGRTYAVGNFWDKPSGSVGKPQVLVRKNASQTFNSNTATDVSWGTVVYDKGGDFSTPTFTAPAALGKQRYRFTLSLFHSDGVTSGNRWQILLSTGSSGILAWSYRVPAVAFNTLHYTGTLEMNGGDTAKWQVQRVEGAGSLVTFDDANANFMSVELVE